MADEEDKMRAALSPEVMELARKALGTMPVYVLAEGKAEELAETAAPQFASDRETAQALLSEIASLPPAAISLLGTKLAEVQAVAQGAARKLSMSVEALRAAFDQAREAAEVSARNETPHQKAERLWQEIKVLNTEIKADIEQLHRDQFVSDEAYEQYKKERTRIDAMDNNDPAKPIADKALNEWVQEIAKQAGKAAQEQGNHESHATATHMGKKAEEAVKANEALDALSQTHKEEVTTNIDAVKAKYSVNDTSLDDILAGGTPTLPTPINSKGKAGRES